MPPSMSHEAANKYTYSGDQAAPISPRHASEFPTTNTYYISQLSGGTGGSGGSGGKEGGSGGLGEGPTFQATSMQVVIQNQSAEDREIIQWASPLNFFLRQEDILRTRQPGTGEWFLQDAQVKKWKEGEIWALWCRGMPGAGKTVLVSIIVDDLRTYLANEKTGVAVLYLDHKATTDAHSPTNLLAAVWQQLDLTKPISPRIRELHKRRHAQGTRPSLEEIYSALYSTVSQFSCVFIVVDALDEYPEEHRDTLLRHLWRLGPAVRLMLTSRPHISIDHIILSVETLNIRANEEDIRKYIEGQIQKSIRLSRHIAKSPSLLESIEENIVKRSDGMFLLAKLHTDSLAAKQNVAAVQDALIRLPSDLDGTYDGIIDRINQQSVDDRRLAWRTLSWVLYAKRPLRPSWLKEALAVEPGDTALDPDRQTDMGIVLSVCAGLVAVDEVDNQVRLIHYTTQLYLQMAHIQTSLFPHPQSEITLTCFTYMSLTFEAFSHLLQLPFLLFTRNHFLHYAVEYCLIHARGEPEAHIQLPILSFLTNCSVWWRLWNWKNGGRQSLPDKLRIAIAFNLEVICRQVIYNDKYSAENLLQEAASQGATDTVRTLLRYGVNMKSSALLKAVIHDHEEIAGLLLAHYGYCTDNSSSSLNSSGPQGQVNIGPTETGRGVAWSPDYQWRGSEITTHTRTRPHPRVQTRGCTRNPCLSLICHSGALYEASQRGNEAIVKLFIQYGADVNAGGREHSSVLQVALSNGHEGVARLLIEHGADVNAEGGKHGNALQIAMLKKQEATIRLLIEHGADVNARGRHYSSPLQAAVWNEQEWAVQLLLEHGANANGGGGEYGTLLQAALWKGQKGAARLLIAHGADVNTNGGVYGSPLQAAVWTGCNIELLLAHGADVNAKAGRYGTALQIAKEKRYEVAARLLIQLGADLKGKGRYNGTALQEAMFHKDEWFSQLLIECGADVNAEAGEYGTALHAAVCTGEEWAVQLLIEHGADVKAEERKYGSLLQTTLWNGAEGVARLLIEQGANVNADAGEYGTLLPAALWKGEEGFARLLIEHGADVNAEGGEYGGALQAATKQGREEIVELLLHRGADVNAEGGKHGSALQAAAWNGDEWAVRLLIQHGANVNKVGGEYGSALFVASKLGHENTVQLLLEHGADVNAGEEPALHAAGAAGHRSIVELLIKHGATRRAELPRIYVSRSLVH
ncbi:ANK-REP-REGION domain-containing protein [Mycena venus]|uniref:ANK-REP-REGION domain-containing protein n=1 Tax=Mycena venus TaxID=2733690 RepID=A0A8H7CRR5_9AGAR|nr:ANK-REP-REGION domain-containing protein [Mycena venus]